MILQDFTRFTNGLSKKLGNHIAATSLHFMYYYNFMRIHQTLLRVTPATAGGVTDRVWEITDLVDLPDSGRMEAKTERAERKLAPKGPVLGS